MTFVDLTAMPWHIVCYIIGCDQAVYLHAQVSALYGAMYILESHVTSVVALVIPPVQDFLGKRLSDLQKWVTNLLWPYQLTPSLPSSNSTFFHPFTEKCIGEIIRFGCIIIFHLSKRWKAKFSILCDVVFLVRPQGKFEIDHSWEWRG